MKGFKDSTGKFHPIERSKHELQIQNLDMNNTRDRTFVVLAKSRLMKDSKDLKKLKSVLLESHNEGQSLAEKIPLSNNEYKIVCRDDCTEKVEEVRPLIKHEIDHIFWDEMEKHSPDKIKQFMLDVIEEEPFTHDLEVYKKEITDLVESKDYDEEKDQKELDSLFRKYFDEYHSEIGQVLERINLALIDKKEIEDRVDLAKISKAYDKLHEE